MSKHRNPRARLPKPPSSDNQRALPPPDDGLDGLLYILRDNLRRADAMVSTAERQIEENWHDEEEDENGGILRHRMRIEYLVEAGKHAVRAAERVHLPRSRGPRHPLQAHLGCHDPQCPCTLAEPMRPAGSGLVGSTRGGGARGTSGLNAPQLAQRRLLLTRRRLSTQTVLRRPRRAYAFVGGVWREAGRVLEIRACRIQWTAGRIPRADYVHVLAAVYH